MAAADTWPALPYAPWRDTLATLQLWAQIVGKVRLALTPWLNHSWQVPLYVSARGLTTGAVPAGSELLEIEFDFLEHELALRASSGARSVLVLRPQSVAEFYARCMRALSDMGIAVRIHERPNELPDPIPFPQDHVHAAYDAEAVQRFWRALIQADQALSLFRSSFLGKVSPVHFFWGSFDLAVTRFSGRRAPLHPGGVPGLPDAVAREAYSHEVSSAGFWPGNDAFPRAAFYSYAYPEPPGFPGQIVPEGAYYDATLREFILPYELVRAAPDPRALLLEFLDDSYAAAAERGGWDRRALECMRGAPGRVRPL